MPAGVRGGPGVEKIRHYQNADGKLLVDITRSLRASERSRAAPLANLLGGPCVVPAGITYSLLCGFIFHGSSFAIDLTTLRLACLRFVVNCGTKNRRSQLWAVTKLDLAGYSQIIPGRRQNRPKIRS